MPHNSATLCFMKELIKAPSKTTMWSNNVVQMFLSRDPQRASQLTATDAVEVV